MQLADIIHTIYPVSPSTIEQLSQVAVKQYYPKRSLLVTQGMRSNHIFFISRGLLRGLYSDDGKEDTRWFASDGDVLTSVTAWHTGDPAIFSIEAITDVECFAVRYEDMRRLIAKQRDLQDWVITLLMEQLYVLERRYIIIGTGNARSRYTALLHGRPQEMMNRIPLKYIAQYLNITQETLSRVRADYGKS